MTLVLAQPQTRSRLDADALGCCWPDSDSLGAGITPRPFRFARGAHGANNVHAPSGCRLSGCRLSGCRRGRVLCEWVRRMRNADAGSAVSAGIAAYCCCVVPARGADVLPHPPDALEGAPDLQLLRRLLSSPEGLCSGTGLSHARTEIQELSCCMRIVSCSQSCEQVSGRLGLELRGVLWRVEVGWVEF
jgi:hypothetical protein